MKLYIFLYERIIFFLYERIIFDYWFARLIYVSPTGFFKLISIFLNIRIDFTIKHINIANVSVMKYL